MPDKRRSPSVLTHDFPDKLSRLEVATYHYIGERTEDCQPGVSFEMLVSEDHVELFDKIFAQRRVEIEGTVFYRFGGGVVGRNAVRRLRDLLNDFLADFPEEE